MEQKCWNCRQMIPVVKGCPEDQMQRHFQRGELVCPGSYYPPTWHSKELEFAEMMEQLDGNL